MGGDSHIYLAHTKSLDYFPDTIIPKKIHSVGTHNYQLFIRAINS